MNLPDLALQIVYGRLAWALVAAAVLLAALPTMLRAALPVVSSKIVWRTKAAAVALTLLLMALPGAASPAYWLTLVFQYPSGLLLGFSVVSLAARWQGLPVCFVLRRDLALPLAVLGLVLYLEAFGLLALGLYYGGFGAAAAPLLACVAAAACAVAIIRRRATGTAAALLIGVLLFSLLRLPTGNLWDALLDPLLWSWAVASSIVAVRQAIAARRAAASPPQAELQPELALASSDDTELVQAHAAGIE